MTKTSEEYYISRCLERIEVIVDRGPSDNWATYDFEKLSEAVQERTQVSLSVTTLKRIWGKLKYDSAPTLTTLNALAQFTNCEDWSDFKRQVDRSPDTETSAIPDTPAKKLKRPFVGLISVIVLVAGAYFFFLSAGRRQPQYDPSQFEFKADKMVTEGVPNSVVFHYDAKVKPDSLFIVQTWDISRKTLVSSDKHEHSAIYYYPGFFRTKLIADGQIMKTHDLWITSDGWLCLLEENPIPIYFDKAKCAREGYVEVDEEMLAPHRRSPDSRRVRFFNQRDLGDLMNDNFVFETKVKNEFDDGTNACHFTQVLIQCKDDIIIIPLAAKSCVGDLSLYFAGTHVEAKSADLSGFGADLTEWTSLRIETVDKTATIYVNDREAYTLKFPNDPTGIVGVQFRFNGAAAVGETRFIVDGKVYVME